MLKFLGGDLGLKQDVETRTDEGLKTLGAIKIMFGVRSASLVVRRELCGRVVVPTVTYGPEPSDLKMDGVTEMEFKPSMSAVTKNILVRMKKCGTELA